MRFNSLTLRLAAAAVLWSVVLLIVGGLLQSWLFGAYVDKETGEIHLVEEQESGTYKGELTADGTLVLRQTQPGAQPVVSVMRLPRSSTMN